MYMHIYIFKQQGYGRGGGLFFLGGGGAVARGRSRE